MECFRSKKRRVGEDVDDEHHGEFDANELRQHEEFTKVKNVDKIELGRYQLETWYFSPLPAEYNGCKVGHSFHPSAVIEELFKYILPSSASVGNQPRKAPCFL
jgi:hypothetical protein